MGLGPGVKEAPWHVCVTAMCCQLYKYLQQFSSKLLHRNQFDVPSPGCFRMGIAQLQNLVSRLAVTSIIVLVLFSPSHVSSSSCFYALIQNHADADEVGEQQQRANEAGCRRQQFKRAPSSGEKDKRYLKSESLVIEESCMGIHMQLKEIAIERCALFALATLSPC